METRHFKERYAVKRFDPNCKVSEPDIELLKSAFHLSPSSINVQGWKLIVVESEEAKTKLSKAGMQGNAYRTKDCSHIFIFARKKHVGYSHFKRIISETKTLEGARTQMGIAMWQMVVFMLWYQFTHGGKHWLGRQLYIPLGAMLAICAEHGIGSIPMEGFKWRKVDRILGLKGYRSEVALAVGYPDEAYENKHGHEAKDRLPFEEVIETR